MRLRFGRAGGTLLFACLCSSSVNGQRNSTVIWSYKAQSTTSTEIRLEVIADVLPDWHLYTQHLKPGGPQPTRFRFDTGDFYEVGNMSEKGKAYSYYDDIYEMDITWYSGIVSFTTTLKAKEPLSAIKVEIEYMTCNNQMCIPDKRTLSIPIDD